MNISERIEIIKKGCGKYIDNDYCGDTPIEDYLCEKDNLCPTCLALLKQAEEIKDDLMEAIAFAPDVDYVGEHLLNNFIGKSEVKK